MATALGFGRYDVERIGLAVSELGTNLERYARGGRIGMRPVEGERALGIEIASQDEGPGIARSTELREGVSGSGGLGAGLASVRRMMDDFELSSAPSGTSVVCRKWRAIG
jgi:serine/threonine-protein kinase RsbT